MFTPINLLDYITSIYEWNRIAGNEGKFNKHLAISMLSEEFSEGVIAIKNKDIKEQQDALADILFVFVGEQYKQGISDIDTYDTLVNVVDSNFTKFTRNKDGLLVCTKDENGKILKPETYKEPDLNHLNVYNK